MALTMVISGPHNPAVLTVKEVVERLNKLGRDQWNRISQEADVPFSTLKKIAYGQTKSPQALTLEKISMRLEEPKRRRTA